MILQRVIRPKALSTHSRSRCQLGAEVTASSSTSNTKPQAAPITTSHVTWSQHSPVTALGNVAGDQRQGAADHVTVNKRCVSVRCEEQHVVCDVRCVPHGALSYLLASPPNKIQASTPFYCETTQIPYLPLLHAMPSLQRISLQPLKLKYE
jgi:hypothetical protein